MCIRNSGIIFGTYATVFVASPMILVMEDVKPVLSRFMVTTAQPSAAYPEEAEEDAERRIRAERERPEWPEDMPRQYDETLHQAQKRHMLLTCIRRFLKGTYTVDKERASAKKARATAEKARASATMARASAEKARASAEKAHALYIALPQDQDDEKVGEAARRCVIKT